MRRILLRCLLLLFLVPLSQLSHSQNLTGIWRGSFFTESNQHYKFEVQIKQSGSFVTGVSYSYLSTVFYGKATLTGNFSKKAKSALLREIKTVELRMSGGSQACIMKCVFKYEKSGREEFLEGTFTSTFETDGLYVKKGDNCGGGKVFLRRVTTSDFYIEPFLRGKIKEVPVIVNKAPVKKDSSKTIVKSNPQKKPVIINQPPVKKPVTKPNVPVVKKPNRDSATSKNDPPLVKVKPTLLPTPTVLKERSNELVRAITVIDPDVIVKIYDNGEIDDDTISVYLDNKLVLSSRRLTASPLIIRLKMDEVNDEHELVMVAENLGRIPPNTSLMIVESGGQRFDVRITSTEQKNAMVRFRYVKP